MGQNCAVETQVHMEWENYTGTPKSVCSASSETKTMRHRTHVLGNWQYCSSMAIFIELTLMVMWKYYSPMSIFRVLFSTNRKLSASAVDANLQGFIYRGSTLWYTQLFPLCIEITSFCRKKIR